MGRPWLDPVSFQNESGQLASTGPFYRVWVRCCELPKIDDECALWRYRPVNYCNVVAVDVIERNHLLEHFGNSLFDWSYETNLVIHFSFLPFNFIRRSLVGLLAHHLLRGSKCHRFFFFLLCTVVEEAFLPSSLTTKRIRRRVGSKKKERKSMITCTGSSSLLTTAPSVSKPCYSLPIDS